MRVVAITATLFVCGAAILGKVWSHRSWLEFQSSLEAWSIRRPGDQRLVAIGVVSAEALVMMCAPMAFVTSLALVPAMVLMTALTLALLTSRSEGRRRCHCFGSLTTGETTRAHAVANGALIGVLGAGAVNVWPTSTVGDALAHVALGVLAGAIVVFGQTGMRYVLGGESIDAVLVPGFADSRRKTSSGS